MPEIESSLSHRFLCSFLSLASSFVRLEPNLSLFYYDRRVRNRYPISHLRHGSRQTVSILVRSFAILACAITIRVIIVLLWMSVLILTGVLHIRGLRDLESFKWSAELVFLYCLSRNAKSIKKGRHSEAVIDFRVVCGISANVSVRDICWKCELAGECDLEGARDCEGIQMKKLGRGHILCYSKLLNRQAPCWCWASDKGLFVGYVDRDFLTEFRGFSLSNIPKYYRFV